MKQLMTILLLLAILPAGQAQDKKALKQLEKKYNVDARGNAMAKAKEVAILGANLRFKLASRESGETGSKSDSWVKFGAYAVLEGVSDNTFQEIADEYEKMIATRFEKIGITVKPYSAIEGTKGFAKLKDNNTKERDNVKKSWGVARVFSAGKRDYIAWNYAAPFGPHLKVAKELKSLLYNSTVTVDFCAMGVEVSQSASRYGSSKTVYTEGSSKVVPAIVIDGYTYPSKGVGMGTDNSINLCVDQGGGVYTTKLDLNQSEIASNLEYATGIEKCSGCKPQFAQGRLALMEHSMGTVQIKADEKLYKQAVLHALGLYLDEVFTLYASERK